MIKLFFMAITITLLITVYSSSNVLEIDTDRIQEIDSRSDDGEFYYYETDEEFMFWNSPASLDTEEYKEEIVS